MSRGPGEGALEGPSRHAADAMRNGVGQKDAPEEVRNEMKPVHLLELLFASMASPVCFSSWLPGRLASVQAVIDLIFNKGYASSVMS